MKTTPDNQKLLDLIESARKGKIVLPQFQRNFVWSRDDITALLISIFQGHFIGSFLFLNADSENIPFAVRSLQGIDLSIANLRPDAMVLDGQQRLTSLHYAFAAPDIPLRWTKYSYRFFLDMKQVTIGDWDKAIRSERSIDCNGMLDRQYQFENLIIPLTEIELWDKWLNAYEQWLVNKDKDAYFQEYFPNDKPAWTALMDRIKTFFVPTITIPKIKPDDPEALAEVCAIFEKINSTGVKLSVYDLLTARLYKDKIDLHSFWGEAVDEYHILDEYSEGSPDEFGVYVLRTISLMRGLDVKSKTLINLSPSDFKKDWKKAVEYIEKALHRMTSIGTDGFGAFDRKWMPYLTMVSPLAAMLYAIDKNKFGHKAYHWIQRWYWASVFRERYAGSVESAIYRDYQDFLRSIGDSAFEAEALREARTSILENQAFSLKSINRLNSIYRGVICLVALRGAKDFRADDSIQFHTLEDHHIFPVAYLNKLHPSDGKPFSSERINCVINRTLIADQTNKQISKRSPSQYLKEIIPAERTEVILISHFIESGAQAAMQNDDFETFLNTRERVLIAEITKRIHK
ncbi:MAG: DUF262 domain-containing protein [Chloroflexota bacterium]